MVDPTTFLEELSQLQTIKLFYDALKNYCNERNMTKVLDESGIQGVIDTIENYNKTGRIEILDEKKNTEMLQLIKKYIVKEINGEKKLFFIKRDGTTAKVVPSEEFFNILWMHHVDANHCKSFKLRSLVEASGIFIPFYAAILLLECCPKCSPKQLTLTLKSCKPSTMPVIDQTRKKTLSYRRGYLQILDMSSLPDGNYNFVMTYMDLTTHFLFFRPLSSFHCSLEKDIAIELKKIFLEFGGPVILQTNSRKYTKKIIEKLHEFKIIIGEAGVPSEYNGDLILTLLKNWMNKNDNAKWSIGIYHVQYIMNTIYNKKIGNCPFKALFGVDPKSGLTVKVPDGLNLKLITEETDLHKILAENKNSSNAVPSDTKTDRKENGPKKWYSFKTKPTILKHTNLNNVITKVKFQEDTPTKFENSDHCDPSYIGKPFRIPEFETLNAEESLNQLPKIVEKAKRVERTVEIQQVITSEFSELETKGIPKKLSKIVEKAKIIKKPSKSRDLFDFETLENEEPPKKLPKIVEKAKIVDKLYSTPGPSTSRQIIIEDDDVDCCCVCEKVDDTATVECSICFNKMHKRCGTKNDSDNTYMCKLCFEENTYITITSSSDDEE